MAHLKTKTLFKIINKNIPIQAYPIYCFGTQFENFLHE